MSTHPTLADMVAELTKPIRHREHITWTQHNRDGTATLVTEDHITTHPSLLQQLCEAVEQSGSTEAGNARPGFASKPAARLDAVDALMRIDSEAARWVRTLGEDDPGDELEVVSRTPAPHGPTCIRCRHRSCRRIRRGEIVVRRPIPGSGTAACVRLLHGLIAGDHAHDAARTIRSWWTQARVLTGWDSPAWRPDNTCPLCGTSGNLRVKLAIEAATCIECHESWDTTTIGLLADHIRAEAEQDRRPGANAMPVGKPCHCHTCDPTYPYWVLCPTCGHRGEQCTKPLDHRFPCSSPTRQTLTA